MSDGNGVLDVPVTRRGFLRGAGAGALAVAGGALIARQAQASQLNSLQADWGWCSLCNEITWGTSAFKGGGTCPKQPYNGHAITSSYRYSMVYNQGTTSGLPGTPG